MESRAKIMGHSIHQILIVFPLGLLATAVVFDIISLLSQSPALATVAYWMIASGLVGGLLAAPFGWIDWLAIPARTRAKNVGLLHGLVNVAVLILFGVSWLLRHNDPERVSAVAYALSFLGATLAFLGGWLGGELVSRLGVGVYTGAHLNSPNSLSGRPASDNSTGSS